MPNQIKTYVDHSRETVLWKNSTSATESDILYVEMAGITYPDKNYAIRRTRSTSKRSFEYLYVIEYVMSGAGHIESEGQSARVEAGDLYIIHRRKVHSYYADKQQPFSKKWINLSGSFMNSMEDVFLGEEPFTVVHLGKRGEQIIDSIHKCLLDTSEDMSDTNAKIMKLLLDMFLLIDAHKKSAAKELTAFECITDYIDRNIGSELTVSTISEKFFISSSTLYRMFTAAVGMSPKEYILSRKIKAAKRMIAANDSNFNTIAASLGFYDSHHFFRTFRSLTGMSPTEYRNMILEEEEI